MEILNGYHEEIKLKLGSTSSLNSLFLGDYGGLSWVGDWWSIQAFVGMRS